MSCGAVLQNPASQEQLAMAGDLSSRMRSLELEVWSDRKLADGENPDKEHLNGGASVAFRKGTLKKVSNLHNFDEDKENRDPFQTSRLPVAAARPSHLHPRYPLQDITALIYSLQGLEMQSSIETSYRLAGTNDTRVCRNKSLCATRKRSGLLQMR